MIKFKLAVGASLPKRGSEYAAGLDICAQQAVLIPANGRAMVHTGVTLAECPKDIYLRVAPRSKLAYRNGLDVLAGVVDSDYRGEIGVILLNTTENDYQVFTGDAIAQLIAESIKLYETEEVIEVTDSSRGTDGIHSSELRR